MTEHKPRALRTPAAHFCYSAQANVQHTHAHMCSVAPGVISQQDGVQVATHMVLHVRDAITRSRGDNAAAKTSPLLSDSPACVTAVTVSSSEHIFVLAPSASVSAPTIHLVKKFWSEGLQVHLQTKHCREEAKNEHVNHPVLSFPGFSGIFTN